MSNPIVIIFPTQTEAAEFTPLSDDVMCVVGGIGGAECGATCARIVAQLSPRMVVLAGIAGAYPGSGLAVGDTVLVARERIADMGYSAEDGFHAAFAHEYDCPMAESVKLFEQVFSNSVNCCAAPFAEHGNGYKIENMEGASVFAVCTAMKVPFLELRTVSNEVSIVRGGWNIPLAVSRLAQSLNLLLDEIDD